MQKQKIIASLMMLPLILHSFAAKKNKVGGQAIIEGVMMRSKQKISWAVRKPNGEVVVERFPFVSITKKFKVLAFPIIRGSISLFESVKIGYKALERSAEIASEEIVTKKTETNTTKNFISFIITFAMGLVISIGIFMYLPMQISQFFFKNTNIEFNIVAGIIRIMLFLAYISLISMWKEIKRVFEFHGAEHKAIFAFENDKELTLENIRPYTTLHPRCGTSFLFLVAMICMLLFSIIDTIITMYLGAYPNVFVRMLVHIALIPLVSGTSFEVLRLSDRFQHVPFVKFVILPGLLLQKITTKQPDDEQMQIAASALKASL